MGILFNFATTDNFTQQNHSQNDSEQAIYLEYTGDKNGNFVPDPNEIEIKQLKGDGDFRSKESISLLTQADIVVTMQDEDVTNKRGIYEYILTG